ncbi:MAG: hypothetical protein AVDCRST_MAG37-1223 [uncultured Rubrobacteraceae bacterium]|uniref:Uncharacterized protein n=1 Tax=uncultured Rubrobacteraceae bacterium TaxID=349277 RepID=A0A6J4QFT6_9ACTN|nr:MAG: hypothetical protein AVDCRST_MAG37-1223 [uncultured Rubrobacteraceae bacterium]
MLSSGEDLRFVVVFRAPYSNNYASNRIRRGDGAATECGDRSGFVVLAEYCRVIIKGS